MGLLIPVHPLTREVTDQLLWCCSSLGLKDEEQIQSWYESRQKTWLLLQGRGILVVLSSHHRHQIVTVSLAPSLEVTLWGVSKTLCGQQGPGERAAVPLCWWRVWRSFLSVPVLQIYYLFLSCWMGDLKVSPSFFVTTLLRGISSGTWST